MKLRIQEINNKEEKSIQDSTQYQTFGIIPTEEDKEKLTRPTYTYVPSSEHRQGPIEEDSHRKLR